MEQSQCGVRSRPGLAERDRATRGREAAEEGGGEAVGVDVDEQAAVAGPVRLVLPARPELFRPGGVLQGGYAMTLADVAFWIAIMSRTGVDEPAVTLEQTSAFLGAARRDLVCDAELLRAGGTVVYGTATVRDDLGALVSHHTLTYARPSSSPVA